MILALYMDLELNFSGLWSRLLLKSPITCHFKKTVRLENQSRAKLAIQALFPKFINKIYFLIASSQAG